MPIIKIFTHKNPLSKHQYSTIAKRLSIFLKTPPETIRLIWIKLDSKSIYNWGDVSSNTNAGPIIEAIFRDRLGRVKLQQFLILIAEIFSNVIKCARSEVFVYASKIHPGEVISMNRIWQGGSLYKSIK